jgi:hypothetical protein
MKNPNVRRSACARGISAALDASDRSPVPRPADGPSAKPQIINLRYDRRTGRRPNTWPFALALLCGAFCLTALAQFTIPWQTIDGGGGISTGGVFRVTGTIGQPDAGPPAYAGGYTLVGGFWALPQLVQTPGAPTLTIVPANPGFATISWAPATGTNWVLQEATSLSPPNWTNSPSGATNPVTVPATQRAMFYRLFKP